MISPISDNIDLLISSQRALLKKTPLSRIVTLAPNALSDSKEILECSRLAEEKYSKCVTFLFMHYTCTYMYIFYSEIFSYNVHV